MLTGGVVVVIGRDVVGVDVAGVVAVAGALPVVCVVAAVAPVVGVVAGSRAEDFPLARTANHSCSTFCPVAWPLFLSLTKWYSALW